MGLLLGNQYDCQVTELGRLFSSLTLVDPRVFFCQIRKINQTTKAYPVKTGDAKLRVFLLYLTEKIARLP
jgi:hypothetical protein